VRKWGVTIRIFFYIQKLGGCPEVKFFTRLFELRDEVKIFLKEHTKKNLFEWFHDENWLIKLAYLSDIFNKLNETNLGLQGKETSIFQANDKIEALIGKLDFWVDCV